MLLFGSLVRGDAVPGSDADLLIVLRAPALPFPDRHLALHVRAPAGDGVRRIPPHVGRARAAPRRGRAPGGGNAGGRSVAHGAGGGRRDSPCVTFAARARKGSSMSSRLRPGPVRFSGVRGREFPFQAYQAGTMSGEQPSTTSSAVNCSPCRFCAPLREQLDGDLLRVKDVAVSWSPTGFQLPLLRSPRHRQHTGTEEGSEAPAEEDDVMNPGGGGQPPGQFRGRGRWARRPP